MPEYPDCPATGPQNAPADARLLAQGWTRRFLADAERAKETASLYRSLGFEVLVEKPSPADFGAACAGCAEHSCRSYLMIYTRPQGSLP